MKKSFLTFASALAVAICAVGFAPLSARGAVYVAGLAQAKFTNGQNDYTSDIDSADTLTYAAGTIMADTTDSATDWAGTSWSWGGNTSFGYLGEMYMEAGTTYTFGKSVDDMTYLVINGSELIKNTSYNTFVSASFTTNESTWVPIEVRFGNGGGGAGLSSGATYGFAYNTTGLSDWLTFKAANGWTDFRDSGDASFLRRLYSETDLMTVESIVQNDDDLEVTLSFTDVPNGGGSAVVFYGAGNGGTDETAWDSTNAVVTVSAGATASATYTIAGAGSAGFAAVKFAGTTLPFFQWSDSFNLNAAAPVYSLSSSDVSFTNATFLAAVQSLGSGASSAESVVQLSTSSDFSTTNFSATLAQSGTGSESVAFTGLAMGTTYYARLCGTNDLGVAGASSVITITTRLPAPVFTPTVNMDHIAPDISLSFTDTGWGTVTRITVQVSTSEDFTSPALSKSYAVNLSTMPTNVDDIVLSGFPASTPLCFRFIAENSTGYESYVDLSVASSVGDDNVWSGLSENIADSTAYVFAGGLPDSGNKLYFNTPAGLSPVVNDDTAMPALYFTDGQTDTANTSYLEGYHSCGYDLSGSGVLSFTAEKPIWHATKGTNVIENPILFNRSNSQTVYVVGRNGRLDLTGELTLPDGVTNTTMRVHGEGGEVHFGGPSPDFMGTLFLESSFTLSLDHPCAMTNVNNIYFDGGWGSFTYLKNNTGAPMTFPRCAKVETTTGWSSTRACFSGAPMLFPDATLIWYVRAFDGSTFNADVFVKDIIVGKNSNGGDAGLDKRGTGTLAVSGTTSWSEQNVKHYVRLRGGCFYPQIASALPPSGEFYVPVKNEYGTLGLSGDYSPMLDGSSTPRVFQETSESVWGFTGFGGDRVVCWNADPALNLTNTTSHNVSIKLADASSVSVGGKTFDAYYAYPSRLMFGNRSEFADGTVIFRNPIRYELGQNWDTATYFESTNHVVAARMRGSLKLGNDSKTWYFSGRNFGGYLALEADNEDFTGKVDVYEKGNLLVNSNLVAQAATVESGAGLGGVGSLTTAAGTTVKSGGTLFGGEWDKGGKLTLGGSVTLESGSALRAEFGSSADRVGHVKLAAGSTLAFASPIYVDIDTDPDVSPSRGTSQKVLDWSEATFASGSAPTRSDFVARPERNSDLRSMFITVRDNCLYVNYVSVRYPLTTILLVK